MIVSNTEDKEPKKGGYAINVQLEVAEDWKHAKRTVFDYQCIDLPHSAKGTEMGIAKHKSLCAAAGFEDFPTHHGSLTG